MLDSLEESVSLNHPLRIAAALLATLLLGTGCPSPVTPKTDTRTTAQKALDSLSSTDFTFPELSGTSLASLSTSFKVPVKSKDGAFDLSWTATPMDYFSKIDPLSGQIFVNIPDSVTADTMVSLTVAAMAATARDAATTSADGGAAKTFSVTIHPITDTTQAVNAVLSGLSGDFLDLSGKDSASNVTGNFTLPQTGSFGTEISWKVTDSSGLPSTAVAVGSSGVAQVTPPATGSATAKLTPTVKKKGGAGTAGTPITITVPAITTQEKVDLDAAALPELVANALVKAGKGDTMAAITSDFTLPLAGDRGTTLAWTFAAARVTTGPVAYAPASGAVLVTPAATDTSLALAGTISMADANPKTITIKVKVKGGGGGGTGGTGSNSISVVVTNPTTLDGSASLSFLDPGSVAITSYTLKKGQMQTLSASFAATSYNWYIDGITGTSLSTSASCNVDSANLGYGRHFLLFEATTSDGIFSGTIGIDVVPLPSPGLTVTVTAPTAGSTTLTFQNSAGTTIATIIIGKTTPVTVKTSFTADSLAWYLDDNLSTAISTTATCLVNATSLGYGRHSLHLEAKVGTAYYSGSLPFDVGGAQ
ncbi:MAG: immunoglobulin-like domain-containing protein [Rectinemataceae bacterium]